MLMDGEMEEAFGVEIDPASFLQHPTIGAALQAVEQQHAITTEEPVNSRTAETAAALSRPAESCPPRRTQLK